MDDVRVESDQAEEEGLVLFVSDEELEAANGRWATAVFTLAACTGLSACPA
jgi:hypothetical protein